jgi:hypothetical protein
VRRSLATNHIGRFRTIFILFTNCQKCQKNPKTGTENIAVSFIISVLPYFSTDFSTNCTLRFLLVFTHSTDVDSSSCSTVQEQVNKTREVSSTQGKLVEFSEAASRVSHRSP